MLIKQKSLLNLINEIVQFLSNENSDINKCKCILWNMYQ